MLILFSGSKVAWNFEAGVDFKLFKSSAKILFDSRQTDSTTLQASQALKFEAVTTTENEYIIKPGQSVFIWQWCQKVITSDGTIIKVATENFHQTDTNVPPEFQFQ